MTIKLESTSPRILPKQVLFPSLLSYLDFKKEVNVIRMNIQNEKELFVVFSNGCFTTETFKTAGDMFAVKTAIEQLPNNKRVWNNGSGKAPSFKIKQTV